MNDQPVEGPGQEAAPPPPAPPPKQSFRDRTWSLPQLIAVALVAVILGGLGGAAVASAAGGDDERLGPGQGRFERGGPNGPPGMHWRQRQRMKEWKQEHRLPPAGPPPSAPFPSPPTPSTPTPSG